MTNNDPKDRPPEAEPSASLRDIPIGTGETGWRLESDSLGEIPVPAEHYWGAQTQRALAHFPIGDDRLPPSFYQAYGFVKKAAARVNARVGLLSDCIAEAVGRAAEEVSAGLLDDEFPLSVWQGGSGTQANMNVNEVVANRAIQLLGGKLGSKSPVHPNDQVNLSQSTNDTFPTTMHIASAIAIERDLLPRGEGLAEAVEAKAAAWSDVVKMGRTHLQDAVPLTVGQEWSGYGAQIREALALIRCSLKGLYRLAAGGTAVGTGLNAPPDFGPRIAAEIANLTGLPFETAPNKFAALAGSDALVAAMAGLKGLAVALLKIAGDLRLLASGPRGGLGELILPANEPGSSIMPGKVNPFQCEALMMICVQVISADCAVSFAGSQGNLQLNTMRPLISHHFLHATRLLADGCEAFRRFAIAGTELNRARVAEHLNRSLMLVTALTPVIGYDRAAAIAHRALRENITLREAALASGEVTAEEFDMIVKPENMVGEGNLVRK
ncbi:MAG: class II fumarate hydratase [Deltaproteobacteria bacterium]|nr:class II fumarate hydratase [Deltaproteobacteria bacterium]